MGYGLSLPPERHVRLRPYDGRHRKLFMARDRLGKAALYALANGELRFASELKR